MTSTTTVRKLSIELPVAQHSRIKQIATECATSMSDIITEAIQVYLNTSAEEIDAKLNQQPKT